MSKEFFEEFAGNLIDEVEESNKMIPNSQRENSGLSHTAVCDAFLTIYCC